MEGEQRAVVKTSREILPAKAGLRALGRPARDVVLVSVARRFEGGACQEILPLLNT
jgi:hypothetical protein